ncbi:MAG: AMP-binding protein [Desulfovibrionaceae bacterium]|nr:AMP-binding protein [Desulfovibrionaceae bacterium]
MKKMRLDIFYLSCLVHSVSQTALRKDHPLAVGAQSVEDFLAGTWEKFGYTLARLEAVTQDLNAMCGTEIAAPKPSDGCRLFCEALWEAWRIGDRVITFFTSGSTGEPKPCRHLEEELLCDAQSAAKICPDVRRVLVTVPRHHMFGSTFGLLLPRVLNVPVRLVPPFPTALIAELLPGDLVVTVPFLLANCCELFKKDFANVTVVSATAPLHTTVFHAIQKKGIRLLEIYGFSEIGAMAYRWNAEDPYTLLPNLIREADDTLVRILADGRRVYYSLPDHFSWIDAFRGHLGERIDRAVQVGGINVYPKRVAATLLECDGVASCLVRLMRPEEGYRLKAFIVPKEGVETEHIRERLRSYAREHLSAAEQPGTYTVGSALPKTLLGKSADW